MAPVGGFACAARAEYVNGRWAAFDPWFDSLEASCEGVKTPLRANREAEAGTGAEASHTAGAAVVVAGRDTIAAWAACAEGSHGEVHTAGGGRARHRGCGAPASVSEAGYGGNTAARSAYDQAYKDRAS